jgi:hypothetical protein
MIPLIVFLCGCVIMSFEILGSRILAPHFGNDLFVWGSLIGVFLSGLTLGYWSGCKLADVIPDLRFFALLLFIPGLNLCLLPLYSDPVNIWIFDSGYGRRIEPLLASVVLFFPPTIFMGAVSPFAVKLQVKNINLLGSGVGNLYALSSSGSIFGTLLTAFYLITLIGVRKIIVAEGVLLILMALAIWGVHNRLRRRKVKG